jgi:hypothetical protein
MGGSGEPPNIFIISQPAAKVKGFCLYLADFCALHKDKATYLGSIPR